jgi:hypothetical protein
MSPIEDALASLESLKPGEKPCYAKVAREYGCDRNTLSRRHRGVQGSVQEKVEYERLLTLNQEKELIKYIDLLTTRNLPPTKGMIWNFAEEIAGKRPGNSWTDWFVNRHKKNFVSH